MMHHWNTLGWRFLLAAALTAGPSPGQVDGPGTLAAEPDKTDAIVTQLADLKKALEEAEKRLKESITSLDTNANLKIQKLQADTDEIKRTLAQITKLQADTDEVRRQLAQIRQELDSLKNRPSPAQISSLYGPPNGATGRVRLVNTFPDAMTILVNERAYRLNPGETRLSDPIPAGTFTYQVLSVQPEMQTRPLSANETFTITVHPR